jgi:hypothetical protein
MGSLVREPRTPMMTARSGPPRRDNRFFDEPAGTPPVPRRAGREWAAFLPPASDSRSEKEKRGEAKPDLHQTAFKRREVGADPA